MIDIGTLGGDSSKAQDINNNGQITGQSATTGNASEHAFIYNISTGTRSDLGTLDGQRSLGFDINDSGQVAGQASSSEGWRAFFYNGSTMLNLGTLSGHHDSAAYGINGKGYIVGGSWPAGSNEGHAFLYNGTTILRSLASKERILIFLVCSLRKRL